MSIFDELVNFSEVLVDGEHTAGDTDVDLQAGQAARLPLDGPFNLVWFDVTNFANPADDPKVEVIRVPQGGIVGDGLENILRGQENSGATSKNTPGSQYKMLLAYTKGQREQILVEIQQNLSKFALTAGSSVAYTATLDPVPTAYFNGMTLHLRIHLENTAAATLNVNGLGAIPLVKQNGISLSAGDITADQGLIVMFSQGKFYGASETVRDTDLVNWTQNTGTVTDSDASHHDIDVPSNPAAYSDAVYRFIAETTNNGISSLDVDGLGLKVIKKQNGVDLEAGDIEAGDWIMVMFDVVSDTFQLVSSLVTQQLVPQVQFAFAYKTDTQAIVASDTFEDVLFTNNGELDGWTHPTAGPTSANFTSNKIGRYLVVMSFLAQDTGAGTPLFEFIGLVNGTEVPGSQLAEQYAVNNQPMHISKSFIIDITTVGHIFKIQMAATTDNAELVAAGANATTAVSASVTITRI